ncbi:MAG: MFS transporter [Zoogloeaceae bacterium]|jgi:MFS family permease|nr:MFS transporter [Zoogloeaceae bacterium]
MNPPDNDISATAPHAAQAGGRHSQFRLLRERRFGPLFVTQFCGAFNDNIFKNALIVLLAFHAAAWTSMRAEVLTNLATALFILPFFLFSATAGNLADKYDKAWLARLTKILEIVIILIAALGFFLENLTLLLTALFLLGLQSTFFGPLKYAILPQHLKADELVGGNALVEAGTFISILLGTLIGSLLAGLPSGGTAWISGVSFIVALTGYLASCRIPPAPAPAPELVIRLNLFSETWRCIQFARVNRSVFLSILGISWFWLYGSIFLAQFPVYTKNVLAGDSGMVALLLAVFSVGIGGGSLLCEKLSRHQLEPGLVPFGALGLTLFGLDLAWASPVAAAAVAPLPLIELIARPNTWRLLVDLLLLGACGGIYCVPLYALVQQRSDVACRARVIAANNILNSLFMVIGALFAALLLKRGYSFATLFAITASVNALVALYIFSLVPEFVLRAIRRLKRSED